MTSLMYPPLYSLFIFAVCSSFLLIINWQVIFVFQKVDSILYRPSLHMLVETPDWVNQSLPISSEPIPVTNPGNASFSVIIVTHNEPLLLKTLIFTYLVIYSVQSVLENTNPVHLLEVVLYISLYYRSL